MNLALQNFCRQHASPSPWGRGLGEGEQSGVLLSLACHGPSLSESAATNQSAQTSVQGSAGNTSPTVVGGGDVNYNDPQVITDLVDKTGAALLATIQQNSNTTNTVLQDQANNAAAIAQNGAASSDQETNLLSQLLQANAQLATAQGTGGASLTSTTNNYLIWGAIGVAAIAVFALMRR